ncbi:MAG: hypothetical protein H6818_21085 [Phycisphaerales bacterium]|nr:hypothetical protein [Phycisphaerales bacterium]MCB9862287.1 hypothetical protein [Phycisphaerales bacterium]
MKTHFEQISPGYAWLIRHGLVGFKPDTALTPWYFMPDEEQFDASVRWPAGSDMSPLLAFARRQDCDDIACFWSNKTEPTAVIVIHGWTQSGYDIVAQHTDIWNWLKSAIDEIADCCDREFRLGRP